MFRFSTLVTILFSSALSLLSPHRVAQAQDCPAGLVLCHSGACANPYCLTQYDPVSGTEYCCCDEKEAEDYCEGSCNCASPGRLSNRIPPLFLVAAFALLSAWLFRVTRRRLQRPGRDLTRH